MNSYIGDGTANLGYVDYIVKDIPRIFKHGEVDFLRHPIKSPKEMAIRYIRRRSDIGRETIENPGSWRILDRLYGNVPGEIETGTFTPKHWLDRMFYDSSAAEATRARFKEYLRLMKQIGIERAKKDGHVSLLSLASGPGRDVIEATEFLRGEGIEVFAVCVDKSKEAMEVGSKITRAKGLSGAVQFKRYNVNQTSKYENGNHYDIIITQGIMDYLDPEKATTLLGNARQLSKEGGQVITSNMAKHLWMKLWMEVFGNWKLIYRDENDIKKLFKDAGYSEDGISVGPLPEGYHILGIGKKLET